MSEMEQVVKIFPKKLREMLAQAGTLRFQVQELRLRCGQPLLMKAEGEEWYLSKDGGRWIQAEAAGPVGTAKSADSSEAARTAKSASSQCQDEWNVNLHSPSSGRTATHESLTGALGIPELNRLFGDGTFTVNLHAPANWRTTMNESLQGALGMPELNRLVGDETFTVKKKEKETDRCYRVTVSDIRDTLEYMSRYSLYAFDEELRQGFLTIPGGHRIGVAGQAVMEERKVKALINVSFLNVRVARQVMGCADSVLPLIYEKGRLCSCLVVSPPGCGKTTILRDMIRQVSDGWLDREHGTWMRGMTVGVVDERSELAACCQGKPQNDLGIRTDVLDGCPKAEGMMMLIRSMAPQVVAVDEIGSKEDLEAIRYSKNCGCLLLATAHGISLEDIQKKPVLQEFAAEGVFERIIILESRGTPGQVKMVTDGAGKPVGRKNR